MVTHPGARFAGPLWLAAGAVVFVLVRRSAATGCSERVDLAGRAGRAGGGRVLDGSSCR